MIYAINREYDVFSLDEYKLNQIARINVASYVDVLLARHTLLVE